MSKQLLSSLGLCLLSLTARAQWVSQPIGFASNQVVPLYLDAVDANTAWAVGSDALSNNYAVPQLARTVNAGQTWAVTNLPVSASTSETVTSMAAISPSTAWLTTVEPNGSRGRILRTTDSGQSWTVQSGPTVFGNAASFPTLVRFFSPTEGVAVGEELPGTATGFEIYTTANAGQTWTRVLNLPPALANESLVVLPPAVFGSNIWFVTDKGRVFRSPDRGQTWTAALIDPAGLEPTGAIAFRDAQNGLLSSIDDNGGTDHLLYRTADGGRTWTEVVYTGPLHGIGLSAVPGTTQFVSTGSDLFGNGDDGSSVSRDNGQTWVALERSINHLTVEFLSPTVGWSGGFQPSGSGFSSSANRFNSTLLATRTDAALQAGLRVVPNPATGGLFRLESARTGASAATVRVLDVAGRLVQQQPWNPAAPLALDLSREPAGLYVLEVQAASGTARQKVVVQ